MLSKGVPLPILGIALRVWKVQYRLTALALRKNEVKAIINPEAQASPRLELTDSVLATAIRNVGTQVMNDVSKETESLHAKEKAARQKQTQGKPTGRAEIPLEGESAAATASFLRERQEGKGSGTGAIALTSTAAGEAATNATGVHVSMRRGFFTRGYVAAANAVQRLTAAAKAAVVRLGRYFSGPDNMTGVVNGMGLSTFTRNLQLRAQGKPLEFPPSIMSNPKLLAQAKAAVELMATTEAARDPSVLITTMMLVQLVQSGEFKSVEEALGAFPPTPAGAGGAEGQRLKTEAVSGGGVDSLTKSAQEAKEKAASLEQAALNEKDPKRRKQLAEAAKRTRNSALSSGGAASHLTAELELARRWLALKARGHAFLNIATLEKFLRDAYKSFSNR
ncbi:MAG: hypothetical protein QM784_22805 [Polyangiaceae bacterium]